MHKPSKSSNTRMSESGGTVAGRPLSHVQHKIMEQFVASKAAQQQLVSQSHKQKQTSSKVTQALKENNCSLSHVHHQQAGDTRNENNLAN